MCKLEILQKKTYWAFFGVNRSSTRRKWSVAKKKPPLYFLGTKRSLACFFCKNELTSRRAKTTIKEEKEKEGEEMLPKKPIELLSAPREGQQAFFPQRIMQMMRSSVLPSQEGFAFQSQMLRKLEKVLVVTPFLASPPQKCVHSLGAMQPPFPLMEIHSNYNFTKKESETSSTYSENK